MSHKISRIGVGDFVCPYYVVSYRKKSALSVKYPTEYLHMSTITLLFIKLITHEIPLDYPSQMILSILLSLLLCPSLTSSFALSPVFSSSTSSLLRKTGFTKADNVGFGLAANLDGGEASKCQSEKLSDEILSTFLPARKAPGSCWRGSAKTTVRAAWIDTLSFHTPHRHMTSVSPLAMRALTASRSILCLTSHQTNPSSLSSAISELSCHLYDDDDDSRRRCYCWLDGHSPDAIVLLFVVPVQHCLQHLQQAISQRPVLPMDNCYNPDGHGLFLLHSFVDDRYSEGA